MGKEYSHMTIEKRKELARLLSESKKVKEIASLLEIHIASVYREIERGKNPLTNQYDPEYAEESYKKGLKNKGKEPVLSEDKELAAKIAKLLLNENLSLEQALLKLDSMGYTETIGTDEVPDTNKTETPDVQQSNESFPWWAIVLLCVVTAGIGFGVAVVVIKKKP